MTVERYLRLIAGVFVLASLLLGYYFSPYFFLFTGFVALNLIQSAFSGWCPMISILRWLGARDEGSAGATAHHAETRKRRRVISRTGSQNSPRLILWIRPWVR